MNTANFLYKILVSFQSLSELLKEDCFAYMLLLCFSFCFFQILLLLQIVLVLFSPHQNRLFSSSGHLFYLRKALTLLFIVNFYEDLLSSICSLTCLLVVCKIWKEIFLVFQVLCAASSFHFCATLRYNIFRSSC